MTDIETAAWASLWGVLLVLTGLVFLLFRQLEKAYSGAVRTDSGLPAGSDVPRLEVQTPNGLRPFFFETTIEPVLAAFVRAHCPACTALMATLREGYRDAVVFVSGTVDADFMRLVEDLSVFGLGHPFDAEREWNISAYPTVFAIREGHIAASTTGTSARDLRELVSNGTSSQPQRLGEVS